MTCYFAERAGLCNPSLYYNFANASNGFVPDESGLENHGSLQDAVRVIENFQCGRGAEFTNGHIKIDGKNFNGMYRLPNTIFNF